MYEQFFGLRERPFDLTPNPRYLVLTESHREALSNLEYGITSRKGITLLVGEAGSGKTTVIRTAIDRQPTRTHCVYLSNPTLSRTEFIEMLAVRFGLSERAATSKAVMLIELENLLRDRRGRDETTVLVVDEAQSLSLELLEEIRLLANIETDAEKLLSVIIAGQPEIVDRLNEQGLRQLKQRVALRCELKSLTRRETATYLAGRIRAAGGVEAHVFTREAVDMIHDRAVGLPRTISVIADNALLGGFAAGERPVGTQIVQDVCRDFDLGMAPIERRAPLERLVKPGPSSDAAQMPGRPTTPAAASRRLLDVQPATAAAPAKAGVKEPIGKPAAPEGKLFGGFSLKRRRFSLFRS